MGQFLPYLDLRDDGQIQATERFRQFQYEKTKFRRLRGQFGRNAERLLRVAGGWADPLFGKVPRNLHQADFFFRWSKRYQKLSLLSWWRLPVCWQEIWSTATTKTARAP